MRGRVIGLVLVLLFCSCGGDDETNTETREIIDAWVTARLDGDAIGAADLYAEDGVYADAGCPFEMNGRQQIRNMVWGHMSGTEYTTVDPVSIDHTENGAVVRWVWAGTAAGEPFRMEPSTTFVIENGLIVRSTDAYELTEAPPAWQASCVEYNS